MASESTTDMENAPLEALSTVWVKMEVEDEPEERIDEDQLEIEYNYQETEENSQETEENNQDTEENNQDTEENSQESEEIKTPPRRKRRKPAAPRKAKNVVERIFKCEHCDYKALHKSTLNYHMMKHTNPEPLPCEMCNYTTRHAASLRRHMLAVHTDKNDPIIQAMPDIKCKDCDFTCKFSWKLFVHRRKHVEKTFQCEQCDFATGRKSNFEKHCNTHKHKDGATYECDKCPFFTKHEGHIARHLAVVHKEVSKDACKCEYCDFSTKIRWRLNIHKKNSRHEKPIKCEFCDFVTEYNCEYKLHKLQHISDLALLTSGMAPPTDQDTGLYIPQAKGLMAHSLAAAASSTSDKEFIVDTDCEEIDWRSIEVGEKAGQEKPFHCILCQYKSRFKASVQRHFQRNHTSENSKPYKCVNCGFSTKTRDQISLHNKRSKAGYVITCKTCEFSTYYKCQMAEHQKSHWQYKCKLCEFICRISYDLNQHYTVVHLGQGFKCRYCEFTTGRKGTLLNHENTHINKRFRCGLCDYSATRRNLLINHLKRCHAGEPPKIIISDRKFNLLQTISETGGENVVRGMENVERGMEYVERGMEDVERGMENGETGSENFERGDNGTENGERGNENGERGSENVESDLKNVKSDLKYVGSDDGQIKYECEKNVEVNQLVEVNVESKVFNSYGESKNQFGTQVYVERQDDFERQDIEFQSNNMFVHGSLKNEAQGNVFEMASRQDVFYPL